ncbi:hypothetical protein K474DRAFT_1660308 [Panus rudis PR-1116 ss-1]|nr:hypothetical protein K474DRAFT_1660308 [Panus rudis PR-1116 ss-1]
MELGSGFVAKLEPFLLMSKSAKGAAAAKLIQDATSAPGVFVFAELLEQPSIQELAGHEQHGKYYNLLELFAYKTFADYLQHKDSLPPLNPMQITKLKHLSLVSLAMESRILPYAKLLEVLQMNTIRDLEDLIIDAIYQDLIRGKLDQKEKQFDVEYTMGRDVEPGKIENLLAALQNWASLTTAILSTLDQKVSKLVTQTTQEKAARIAHEDSIQKIIKEITDHQKEVKFNLQRAAAAPMLKSGPTAAGLALIEKKEAEQKDKERERDRENNMDIDEPEGSKGKNRKAPSSSQDSSKNRKRNRM